MVDRSPLMLDAVVECDHCGFKQNVRVSGGSGLKKGSALYTDPQNPNFSRCKKCKRIKLTVVEVETFTSPDQPRGFWRTP